MMRPLHFGFCNNEYIIIHYLIIECLYSLHSIRYRRYANNNNNCYYVMTNA